MTTSTIASASVSSTNSFMTTVNALWEVLNISLEMSRAVSRNGIVNQRQLNAVRKIAERL